MSALTTHVLDTAAGKPARGLKIELFSLGEERKQLFSGATNADGRCDTALLSGSTFKPGRYELLFHVADYFRGQGLKMADPPFLDQVPIRFGIAEKNQHYHVPLLISPYSYSTYRGS